MCLPALHSPQILSVSGHGLQPGNQFHQAPVHIGETPSRGQKHPLPQDTPHGSQAKDESTKQSPTDLNKTIPGDQGPLLPQEHEKENKKLQEKLEVFHGCISSRKMMF